jgi:hypothetical protein
MKYIVDNINNCEYIGTPEEIADLVNRLQATQSSDSKGPDDWIDNTSALVDQLTESEVLRRRLAADPQYNPFGGVVPTSDPADDGGAASKTVSADDDTGVLLA